MKARRTHHIIEGEIFTPTYFVCLWYAAPSLDGGPEPSWLHDYWTITDEDEEWPGARALLPDILEWVRSFVGVSTFEIHVVTESGETALVWGCEPAALEEEHTIELWSQSSVDDSRRGHE